MAQIIRSGAFLQQCWSVHALCVTVRRMTDERAVVLSCSSCKSAHYLTVATVTSKVSSAQQMAGEGALRDELSGEECLKACVSTHYASLTLREMDVFQDLVRLRCADCRRQYELTVSAFETRHK
jgi:ribosomal protein L33